MFDGLLCGNSASPCVLSSGVGTVELLKLNVALIDEGLPNLKGFLPEV